MARMLSVVLGVLALVTVVSGKPVPRWILNHGKDAETATVSQGECEYELGLFRIHPTGTDLTLTLPMKREDAFPAEKFPFFALRYRAETRQQAGGIFFTTDTLTSLSDESYSQFPISGDGAWHHMVVDMRSFQHGQWKGTVTSFRVDPTNPSDLKTQVEISRLGFFPSASEAEKFLSEADDTPDYSRDVLLRGENYKCRIPGGKLSDGWDRGRYSLKDGGARPSGRVTVCRDGKPVPCHVNSRGFVFYEAEKPGVYTVEPLPDNAQAVPLSEETKKIFACIPSSQYPSEYFTRERIRIGGDGLFRTATWNPKAVEDFAECGFDLLLADGADSGIHRAKLLDACDRLGVEVYVNDGGWNQPEKAGMEYFDHPSFTGHVLTDEPGADAFAKWGDACRKYSAATGKMPFINLLPMYANAAQLKFGASAAAIEYYDSDPQLYRKYCEKYCDLVPTPYICTDIYPLNWSKDGKRYTYRDYVQSIHVVASVARERNREFWCYIQTFGWTPSKRTPNASEFRWQCYSMLSFGCRAILCWVYGTYNPQFPSLVTMEGERTPAWYDAKTVFQEIRKLSDVYCVYRNVGAFTHAGAGELPAYLKMTDEYKGFSEIRDVSCPDPLLFGCFEKKGGRDGKAFTVVNMSELSLAKSTIVKVKLEAREVTCYRRGVAEIIRAESDGHYHIPLPSGEGVFVTLK